MFCPKCGNEIKEAAKFCPKCGKELVNQQGSAQQNSNQAQNSQQNKNVKKHAMKTISSKNMEQTTISDFGEDLVSGNIKERHFAKFYTLVKREKRMGMLVYLTILLAFVAISVIGSFPEAISEYGFFFGNHSGLIYGNRVAYFYLVFISVNLKWIWTSLHEIDCWCIENRTPGYDRINYNTCGSDYRRSTPERTDSSK